MGDGGKPATGGYDFIFRLYDAATDGAEVAPAVVVPGLGVTNGYFTTALDYGLAAYQGGAGRWVQVEVRSAGTADAYAALVPRTALTPVPFALYALTAGQVSVTNLPTNLVYATQLQASNAAQLALLLGASNSLTAQLQATNGVLAASVAAVPGQLLAASNVFTGSNQFSGPVVATNGSNQFVGGFSGNGAGLTNVPSAVLAGLLSSGQLPVDVVYAAQLAASNVALRAAVTADLVASSNGVSAQLTATNGALVQLIANEGQLRTNALALQLAQLLSASNSLTAQLQATNAALAASVAAVPGQLLSASNVFTGSNLFTGMVVATNGNNQLVGNFLGNGYGLTNVPPAAVTGLFLPTQIPPLDAAKITSGTLDGARLDAAIARSADLLAATNALRGQMAADKSQLLDLLTGLGITNQAGSNSLVALLTSTSNKLAGDLVTTNALLTLRLFTLGSTYNGKNTFTDSNFFNGALLATNAGNQLVGGFFGNGNGLTNVPVTALAGLLTSGQLPVDVVYAAQLVASNVALRAAVTADLVASSNGLSARLTATNGALVQLVANEGLLRTNALAAQLAQLLSASNSLTAQLQATNAALAASVAAVPGQLLAASNVFTGSNRFSGAVVATNGSNQFVGGFSGNGGGLTNVPSAVLAGLLTSGQLPVDVVYAAQLVASNVALRAAVTADLVAASNGLSAGLTATNGALVQLIANEGQLRTNALAAQLAQLLTTSNSLTAQLQATNGVLAASVAAVPGQLLAASNVFTGSNRFSGPVVATNGSNQFVGGFNGNGGGLTNLPVTALAGLLSSGQLPVDVVYAAQLVASNVALRAAVTADLVASSNGLTARLTATNGALVQLVANEGLLRTNALAAQLAQLLSTSNSLTAQLQATNGALAASVAAVPGQLLAAGNVFTGSNRFSGPVVATNGSNQFVGGFSGNGAGLTNVPSAVLAGLLSSGQLPVDVVYAAQLVASNVALRAAVTADLVASSNGLSARLTATNGALVQLVANEGQLRTNALATQLAQLLSTSNSLAGQLQATNGVLAASVAAVPGQLLAASNVFTGSNRFSGPVVATNGSNQFVGGFSGNGGGLTNLPVTALAGLLSSGQLPVDVVYAAQLVASNVALRAAVTADLVASSNGLSGRLTATNGALVQLVANEGLLRTNALATQLAQLLSTSNSLAGQLQATNALLAASVAALPGQLLSASNVFTGSNLFSGMVVATNGSNQLMGSFSGNGSGLTNVPPAAVTGVFNPAQIPPLDSAKITSGTLDAARLDASIARSADVLAATNALRGQMASDKAELLALLVGLGVTNQAGSNSLDLLLVTASNKLAGDLVATNAQLVLQLFTLDNTYNGKNTYTGSNFFNGAMLATNAGNQLTGSFFGNGNGLTNLPVTALAGLLSKGQLPSDVVYAAQLLASNVALRAAATADLVAASNGLSAQLTATNGALVQLIANEGQLRTNALVAQLAQLLTTSNSLTAQLQATNAVLVAGLTAMPGQLLSASNIFTGSNRFAGMVVATNGSNQLAGSFSGNGGGLTNLSATALTGSLSRLQLPADVLYAGQLSGTNVNMLAPLGVLTTNPANVALVLQNAVDTNRADPFDVAVGAVSFANLFEARSGVISNVLSVDAIGRLSLGRGGALAGALAHFGGQALRTVTTNNAYLFFDSADPDPAWRAGWSFEHQLGKNPVDPRNNKIFKWGFNGSGAGTNEPVLQLNLETWWEPWPGATDDEHQMELYYSYVSYDRKFTVRPWGMVLRGSNFIQSDFHVDQFGIASAVATQPESFIVTPFRPPATGCRTVIQGHLELTRGNLIGGALLLNGTGLEVSDGTSQTLGIVYNDGQFHLHGHNSPDPGSGLQFWGFNYVNMLPRTATNVTLNVFGVAGQATNLMEFRASDTTLLAKVDQNGVVSATGFQVGTVPGISTNIPVLVPGGLTNTLVFSNGILVNVLK
ncbi:MAG: hypothetical protein EBS05_12370 [Proteobacteria bacterium]|nr:hypothetical protein [Pseudomonadota bacterium]